MTTASAATTERLIPAKCENAQKIRQIKSNLRFTVIIFFSQLSALFDILPRRLGRLPLFIHDMHESWKLVVRVQYITSRYQTNSHHCSKHSAWICD